jgi:hypothetical protein
VLCWLQPRGGDLVFVRESADNLFPAAPVIGEVDLRWPDVSLSRCERAKGTVRPGFAAVSQVFSQYPVQVVLIDDQQPPGRAVMIPTRNDCLGGSGQEAWTD